MKNSNSNISEKLKSLDLPDNPKINLETVLQEVESLTKEGKLKNKFKLILKNIEQINFRKEANLNQDEKTVKRKHYLIIVVDKIKQTASKLNLDLCCFNNEIFLFNGEYWCKIQKEVFSNFLKKGAIRMGVEPLEARYYHFKEDLFKQFVSDSSKNQNIDKTITKINLQNGTYEINNGIGKLKNFESKDFIKYQLSFSFNQNAKCKKFEEYLNFVLPERELQDILSEFMASIFINNSILKLEKILLLSGGGSNGKGVFFEIIQALLGEENISSHSLESLTKKETTRAQIQHKLLNFGGEASQNLDPTALKTLASKEPIEAKFLYKDTFIMRDYASLAFNINGLPKDVEHTHGFFRRFIVIPFRVFIPDEKQDKKLPQKIIKNELSGIFNWILKGLDRLMLNEGFTESEIVKNEIYNFKKDNDSVLQFLDDSNYQQSLKNYELQKDIHREYQNYCELNGYRACATNTFGNRLVANKYHLTKKSQGKVIYIEKK